MDVYFISGLGTDRRVFERIQLPAIYTIHYIDWIAFLPGESMHDYAKRLTQFVDTTKPFVLVGLSMGGMVASEMNDFIKPVKTIIISSAANRNELPWHFKLAGFLHLQKIIPLHVLRRPSWLLYWLFGMKTESEKRMFDGILKDSDPALVKASIDAILTWKKTDTPPNLIHIHGVSDKLLPIWFTNTHIPIKGGKHLMVYSKAEELSKVLEQVLSDTIT